MKSLLVLTAAVALSTVPAFADSINLQYTTFGGNSTTVSDGPLTPDMGTAVVNGNSATLTSNNDQVGAVWMDTGLNTQANAVSLQFDLDVLSQAATGYGQAFPQTADGIQTLGGVRIYESSSLGADWAASFQILPTSTGGGVFGFRNTDATAVQEFGSYDTNTVYHIEIDVDYSAGTAAAYIDGVLAYEDYPLRPGNGPDGTTSEIFVYLNGASGGVNNSIQLGSPIPAPLPASAGVGFAMLAGCGALFAFRKRMARKASAV